MSEPTLPCVDQTLKTGVLLVQLGTPDEPTPEAVRRYLKEFLWDRRVVDVNRVLWWFILNVIILNTRPEKSARLYQRLFETYGPVLLTYTQSLTQKVASKMAEAGLQDKLSVRFAMRYGNPSLMSVMQDMIRTDRCDKILIVPMYPQYASATTGSILEKVFDDLKSMRWMPSLRVMAPYAKHPGYIAAQAKVINDALSARQKMPERLIFSYHGIPQRYVDEGDPYACMCLDTSDALKQLVKFPADKILHTYQSRFGKEPWLQPYTDETLMALAKDSVKDVMVACPSFTMDCLETLDEIAVESARTFRKKGGERLELVSCLNDQDSWASALTRMIKVELGGWI